MLRLAPDRLPMCGDAMARVPSLGQLHRPPGWVWVYLRRRRILRKPLANQSIMSKERKQKSPATLGDVLYARSKAPVPEQDWAALVQLIAAGDQLALHALYERAHRMVFTLIKRIAANRETAEELTIDVFHDVWRRASQYDAANCTVLGWIMNQARSRAIDRLRFESRQKRSR